MGFPEDVQQLLLQRRTTGTSYRRTGKGFCHLRKQRSERRLQRRNQLYRRRMERKERKGKTGNPDELPYRLFGRDDGKLVRWTGNGIGKRRSSGRRQRTRRFPRCSEEDAPMVSACISIRTTSARRTGYHRLDRFSERNPKKLDRTFGRCRGSIQGERQWYRIHYLYHPCRHDVRRYLYGIGTWKRTSGTINHSWTESGSRRLPRPY